LINWFILALFVLLYGYVAVLLGVDNGYDFLNYHFYNGYAVIYHRYAIDYAPAAFWTFISPLLDSLNYLIITTFVKAKVVEFILGMMCGLAAFVFYKIVELVIGKNSKFDMVCIFLACLIGLSAPTCISQIGSIQNDFQSAGIAILALYIALRAIGAQKVKGSTLFFAGIVSGAAMGAKLTCTPYAISLLLATFICVGGKQRIKFSILLALGSLLGFLLANGWWMWMLYQHLDNPLFPFYNKIFHSPYFPDFNFADHRFGPKNWLQVFTYPYQFMKLNCLTTELFMQDWRLGILLSFSAIVVILRILSLCPKFRDREYFKHIKNQPYLYFLLIYIASAYLIWVLQFSLYRYAIPIELLSGLLIVYVCRLLLPSNILTIISLAILSFFIVYKTVAPAFQRYPAVGQYIVVEKPIALPDNSVVIITDSAQSFVIPFFPKDVVFSSPAIFYGSEFLPGAKAILKHKGPIFVLISDAPPDPKNPAGYLNIQGLKIKLNINRCSHFLTNSEQQPGFKLCSVRSISTQS
jgi:hypothetical protein